MADMSKLSVILCGVCLLHTPLIATASTIYIDGSLWGDCAGRYDPVERACGDGTETAYQYLASIKRAAKPGTTFILRGGEYAEALKLTTSGTAEAPIVFKAAPGEEVIIGNVNSVEGEEDYGPVWLDNVSYNTVRGITVTGSVGFMRAVNSHHNTIDGNTFDTANIYPSLSKRGGAYFGWSSHNRIVNNRFIKGTDSLALVHADYNVVEKNRFEIAGHELLVIKCGNGNVIRGNHFANPEQKMVSVFDCEIPTTAWVGNGKFARSEAILNRTRENLFEHNVFADATSYYSTSGGNGIQYAGQDGIIRYNTFYKANVGLGMTRYETEALHNTGNRVYHNVFHDNDCAGIALFGAKSEGEKGIADNHYANNILWDNKGWAEEGNCAGVSPGQVLFRDSFIGHHFKGNALGSPLGTRVIHNEFGVGEDVDSGASKGHFAQSVIGDPGFVDAAGHNYRLKAESPVIDKGVFLTRVSSPTGRGRTFQVEDAAWFFDGNGIAGEEGDWIMIESVPVPARITGVDRQNRTLTVESETTWVQGAGVSMPWKGAAPDPGIVEIR
jgi:hypothetical protein